MFKLDRVPPFVIEDIRISKFMRCVTLTGGPRRISRRSKLKRAVIANVFANRTVHALEEVLLSMCQNSRVIILRFNGKTQ